MTSAQPTDPHDAELAQRYGRRSRWPLVAAAVVVALFVVVAGGLLTWAAVSSSDPEVQSALVTFEVVDSHETTASVSVSLADGASGVQCVVRAYAEDKTTVGEESFVPTGSGRIEVSIRTERRATSVENVGCTADGQTRAR
ncbi:DUF4307 domain-containing protein [Nocardioides sp. GY 10127]|uniref:DUF4307 domain-containing protein n=1 Tax=Nocardioides sp. GY 10127 TaxID=2569762 RepID=UPI0014586FAA|nr:DUF4307 domain-containing protein [Nocardioides sp. GY 10127]